MGGRRLIGQLQLYLTHAVVSFLRWISRVDHNRLVSFVKVSLLIWECVVVVVVAVGAASSSRIGGPKKSNGNILIILYR